MANKSLVLILVFLIQLSQANDENHIFKIGALLPEIKSLGVFDNNKSIANAIQFASNKLSELFFKDYGCKVKLDPASTKCDVSYGTRSFFELAKNVKSTLFVFEGSCESTIKPIAESVEFFNITLLSFTETNPTFSDHQKYYGFYRIVPSEEEHNDIRINLIQKFNWTRVGTIYLTQAKYTLAHNSLIRELDLITNLTVSRSIFENQTSDQYSSILDEFKTLDIKIVIGIFDTNTTIKLFCEIAKKNMYGKNYQWIIVGSYNNEFYDLNYYANRTSCTLDQLTLALNGTLQTRFVEYSHESEEMKANNAIKKGAKNTLKKKNKNSKKTLFDEHYPQIVKSYLKKIDEISHKISRSSDNAYFHGYAFDVLLTIFKILSTLIENKQFSCKGSAFERNITWFSQVYQAFSQVSFEGVTGQVSFNKGSRIGQIKLEQLLANEEKSGLTEVLISVYDQNEKKFYTKNEITWHGRNPPTDHTITIRTMYKIPKSIYIGMCSLASTGILLAFGFLTFNIKFRQHRFIKMSSPYLNNLIICGCLLSYTSIYFLGEFDGIFFKYVCVIRLWLLTIGFTLAFGAMFSKTYRVHAILTNSTMTKKVIKDYKLYGIVLFLLGIDIVIMSSWQIFDPLEVVKRLYESKVMEEKIMFVDNFVCESKYFKIWIGALFSFKSLLILFGCFFAYETRHVTIAALNDSKYIGISVYNVLIMCSTGAAIAFIVQDNNSVSILITVFVFSCTTITLCLVFFAKDF